MGLISWVSRIKSQPPKGALHSRGFPPKPILPACGLQATVEWLSKSIRDEGFLFHHYPYLSNSLEYGAWLCVRYDADFIRCVEEAGALGRLQKHDCTFHLVQEVSLVGEVACRIRLLHTDPSEDLTYGPVPSSGRYRWKYPGITPVMRGGDPVEFVWGVLAAESPDSAWVDKEGLLIDERVRADVQRYFRDSAILAALDRLGLE